MGHDKGPQHDIGLHRNLLAEGGPAGRSWAFPCEIGFFRTTYHARMNFVCRKASMLCSKHGGFSGVVLFAREFLWGTNAKNFGNPCANGASPLNSPMST